MFLGIQWNHALIKQTTETESFVLHSLIRLITLAHAVTTSEGKIENFRKSTKPKESER